MELAKVDLWEEEFLRKIEISWEVQEKLESKGRVSGHTTARGISSKRKTTKKL